MTKNSSLKADNVVVFDTETTGLDTGKDQIIEICIQIGLGDDAEVKTNLIKPTIKISKEATKVHGITNEDLKDAPSFRQIGKGIKEVFDKADVIIGYNVLFDINILQAEFVRNNIEPIELHEKKIIDPLSIWRRMRPRSLTHAYKEFCGKELINAHSAEADVRATADVFHGMLKVFELENATLAELTALSINPNWIGISNHIIWKNGSPCFGFGKANGQPIWKYLKKEPGYLDWMRANNFPSHVIQVLEEAVNSKSDEFLEWVRRCYPEPKSSEKFP